MCRLTAFRLVGWPRDWGLGRWPSPRVSNMAWEAELWTPELTGSEESPESWVGHSGRPTAPHHGLLSLQLARRWGSGLGYAFLLYLLAEWPSLWVLCAYTLSECVCPVAVGGV